MGLTLDMTKASDTPFEAITPGFYLLEVETVDDPEEKRNRFFDFAGHPDEQPYEDERGYMQYPTRWSFRVQARPIADAYEDLEDEDVIYIWCNLNYRRNGKLGPNKATRELMEACGVTSGRTDELVGKTIWANVGHEFKDDGSFKSYSVTGYTNQAPKRRQRKAAAPQPEPVEDTFPEDAIPFEGAGDDSVSTTGPQTEDDWIALIRDAGNLDQLKGIGDALRAADAATPEIRTVYQRKLVSFRATTRPTP